MTLLAATWLCPDKEAVPIVFAADGDALMAPLPDTPYWSMAVIALRRSQGKIP